MQNHTIHIPDFRIFSGSSCQEFAPKVIEALKNEITDYMKKFNVLTFEMEQRISEISLGEVIVRKFKDGDTNIVFGDSVRRKNIILLQTARTGHIQEDFDELYQMISTAKRCGAERVTVVMPYYPARQDRTDVERATITAMVRAKLICSLGADAFITVHLHNDTVAGFFDCSTDNLQTINLFVEELLKKEASSWLVIAPDAGAGKKSEKLAGKLNCPMGMIYKTRPAIGVSEVLQITLPPTIDLEKTSIVLFDDMSDSFGTLINCIKAIREAGLQGPIYCCATQPVCTEDAQKNLKKMFDELGVVEFITTDTLPLPNKYFTLTSNVKIISVAPMIAKNIWNQLVHKSVSQSIK